MPTETGPAAKRPALPASVQALLNPTVTAQQNTRGQQAHANSSSGCSGHAVVTLVRPKQNERGRLVLAGHDLCFVPESAIAAANSNNSNNHDSNNSGGSSGAASDQDGHGNSGVTDDSNNAKSPNVKIQQW